MDIQIDTFFKIKTIKIFVFIYFFAFNAVNTFAQLGFCGGNSGDPIFTETFGTGTTNTPLPAGTTTYNFTTNNPQDGFYTVSNNTGFYDWHNTTDHTVGDTNGKCLIVNGDFIVGEFYRTTISGLCENTSYEFSSWLLNLLPPSGCGGNGIPVNVKFQIWDNTNTNLLASGDTSNIFGSSTPNWEQYALVFQTLVGQTSVILKMINNSVGGCGNDLAIDDIVFKSCGDFVSINDGSNNANVTICSSQIPYSTNLIVTPDNSVFNTHFYQWEESLDGIVWTDIIGETNQNIAISGITTSMFYRAKVAESAINLNNSLCNIVSEVFQVIVNQAPTQPTLECWETATLNSATCSWDISGTQPMQPIVECWETATFNNTICDWEVSGVQPIQPTGLACWESTTFNTTTCVWDIFGTQPIQPTLECWETAAFNNTTCDWDISGVQPTQPTGLACWESTTFNTTTCVWDIFGTQPIQPTLECWETAAFNNTTCVWDISGVQPAQPTGLACWETATFNNTACDWEISGSQPVQPTLECWETTMFNTTTCVWDISGVQPNQPTGLACWETATFNNTICDWEISGVQPTQPTGLACWESTTFNTTTCVWDIFGTQPIQPTLECWETAAFNNTTCVWDISGVQPAQPTGLACWETATFNNTACDWEISGSQPVQPTLECWETAMFNTTTCVWDISGVQPTQPIVECWETATFNNTTCVWEILGTQPVQPTLECWETTTFNTTTCVWDISGVQPNQPTGLACWETASFNSTICDWEISGVQPMQPIGLACWEIATFNTTTCVWDVTGTQTVDLIEEFLYFCSGDEITMQAYTDILNPTFLWNTGETSAFKTVDSPGTYTVETTDNCITIVKTIYVEELETPIINTIFSDGNEIIVETLNQGDFEYSLDGNLYQLNNTFTNVEGGLYTIYVKELNGCGVATLDYLHFVIPKYFTPNNDGENETFDLKGIQYFNTSQVSIFDRYGKLLISSKNAAFSWDGTFNNVPLPSSDYWYIIIIEGQKFTGHFTLKR